MRGPAGDGGRARAARQSWSGRLRWTAVGRVALAGAGAAVLAAGLSGCSHQPGRQTAQAQPAVAPVRVSAAELARLPRATTFARIRSAPADQAPFDLTGGLVVHPLQPQVLYAAPGKQPVAVLPATELGGPTWVPVVQASPGWDLVLLPSRPNRATGWIFTGGTERSRLEIRRSSYLIRIQIGARKLSVDDGGRSLGTWTVAVGAAGTPTPGRPDIPARVAGASPPHVQSADPAARASLQCAVHLRWRTGDSRPARLARPMQCSGSAVSNGCVRVPAAALHLLSGIPLGTLVLITR